MQPVDEQLLAMLGEISDLGRARALLAWDEHTKMPPRGGAARAEQIATLTRLRHQRLASDELGRLLDAAEARLDGAAPDSFAASLVRIGRRDWEKARRVPADLRAEIARTTSIAEHVWEAARAEADFGAFLPSLERVIDLKRRYLECFEFDHPYDPLLDDFEPQMTTAQLRPLLDRVREGVRPLLAEIVAADVELDAAPLHGSFSPDEQAALAQEVAALLPLEPDAWRLDPTVHPFATGIAISDLRITTRFDPGYLGTALWSVIHEVGHALYNNGIDPELARTPLCRSPSLGFDESQSRLWENWVGRGRPFLGHLLPLIAERFPQPFAGLGAEELYRAANRVSPSLIRVEADEVTYNLHIVLRFELEVALFEERIAAGELPEAWREKTREYLGIEVTDEASGVLQDVHWAAGSFGYFPTYTLGNVIAAQVWEGVRAELGGLDAELARGDLAPLRDHLRERIYRHGARLWPAELIEALTGGTLDPAPLIAGLRRKYSELYDLA
jgi:carboxypeptidase Taq